MNPAIEKTAKELLADISMGKQFSDITTPNELMSQADNMIGRMAFLVGGMIEAESDYRKEVVNYEDTLKVGEKPISHAAAESRAKAGDNYKNWRKLEAVYKLADDRVKLIKKYISALQEEYKRV